jgi:hypothetical protein
LPHTDARHPLQPIAAKNSFIADQTDLNEESIKKFVFPWKLARGTAKHDRC